MERLIEEIPNFFTIWNNFIFWTSFNLPVYNDICECYFLFIVATNKFFSLL